MTDEEDSGKSFLKHMRGKDSASLTSYANLIYAGMAKVPVPASRAAEFKADLLRYVSRCERCAQPVGSKVTILGHENDCVSCADLLEDVVLRAQANYALYKDHGFCCLSLEGLPYRRGWLEPMGEGDAA